MRSHDPNSIWAQPYVDIGRGHVLYDPKTMNGVLSQHVIDWIEENGLKPLHPDYQDGWSWILNWDQGQVQGARVYIRDPNIRLMFKLAWGGG